MRIKHKYPPNYSKIIENFPAVAKRQNIVFTYGDILYVPNGGSISDDLMIHEETHKRQQKEIGKKLWWNIYFNDISFRLSQELEAYRNQYGYIKTHYGRQLRRKMLRKIAKDLSSPIYGNLINREKASILIKLEE